MSSMTTTSHDCGGGSHGPGHQQPGGTRAGEAKPAGRVRQWFREPLAAAKPSPDPGTGRCQGVMQGTPALVNPPQGWGPKGWAMVVAVAVPPPLVRRLRTHPQLVRHLHRAGPRSPRSCQGSVPFRFRAEPPVRFWDASADVSEHRGSQSSAKPCSCGNNFAGQGPEASFVPRSLAPRPESPIESFRCRRSQPSVSHRMPRRLTSNASSLVIGSRPVALRRKRS